MSRPRRFIRVEWAELKDHLGNPRHVERSRNFQSPGAAAAQVASVQSWPDHLQLLGVYQTPNDWHPFTDEQVDELVAEHLSDDDAERYATLAMTHEESA